MEKVYRLLDWLNMEQALDFLQCLTNTSLTANDLLDLCTSKRCETHIDADGLWGWNQHIVNQDVVATGIHRVLTPKALKHAGTEKTLNIVFEGAVSATADTSENQFIATWSAKAPLRNCEALFRPKDIEALAAEINNVTAQPDSGELECLRKQLEHERAGRITAEAKLAELRKERGNLPDQNRDLTSTALVFPYATKELEAMRDAALKYWANHTQDKRLPTQVEIQLELCELLGLGVSNDKEPPRKTKALAAAIRPDHAGALSQPASR
ncbi:hypothetical protein CXK93_00495 [Stutzerimonas decontaminans]|uniref:Uncharacterized protein n=1 Tax=Stutzerimonas decontaminans TaxID=3022791 RepID=A0ABX4VYP2_9GAMM|nr:hypothetical protein [Stutzerimonas decontaminans]MCQ4247162.1 hypothetical protein [Stutzerimonas decontaminans]PNF85315.1 hypothetical protein CXK93_00495 [Stutzerimonas decontaminans]